jgi:hypothetical protein
MADRAWIVRQGDALVVHSTYYKTLFRATDTVAATQRGGGLITAEESVTDYLRALAARGMDCDFTIPAPKAG